jgi:tetratricopeptide (TPR) repeat protein
MAEAAVQFQKGLDQLALSPNSPERWRQELEFLTALGGVLILTKGQGAPETGQAYAAARKLWERLGFPSGFINIPYGQSRYHLSRGELDLAARLDADLLRLSLQRNDSAGLILGHYSSGRNRLFAGSFVSAQSHFEKVLALYPGPNSHGSLTREVGALEPAGLHLHVPAKVSLGITLLCLGFPDQAMAQNSRAIATARSLGHPPSLLLGLSFSTLLHSLAGDYAAVKQRADELAAVATERGFVSAGSNLWRVGKGQIW